MLQSIPKPKTFSLFGKIVLPTWIISTKLVGTQVIFTHYSEYLGFIFGNKSQYNKIVRFLSFPLFWYIRRAFNNSINMERLFREDIEVISKQKLVLPIPMIQAN